jgi:hypothetical protein
MYPDIDCIPNRMHPLSITAQGDYDAAYQSGSIFFYAVNKYCRTTTPLQPVRRFFMATPKITGNMSPHLMDWTEHPVQMGARRVTRLSSKSSILETNSIQDIWKHVKPGSWLVLDIDNTVARTPQQTGSDQWFRRRVTETLASGRPFENALDEWTMLQFRSPLQLVETCTASLVAEAQRRSLTVMAETSRGIRLGERTVTQLRELEVDFRVTAPSCEEIFWPRGVEEMDKEHVLYEGGILFTAGQHKGKAFQKLCAKLETTPKHVVFVDDSKKHVEHMRDSCYEMGVPFTGLRYGRTDEWVNAYDPDVARVQFAGFERIPSDEEAMAALAEVGQ